MAGFGGGDIAGEALDLGVGGSARGLGLLGLGGEFRDALGRGGDLGLQLAALALDPGQRPAGVLDDLGLARRVGGDPRDLAFEPRQLSGGAFEFAVEAVLLDLQPMQDGGGGGLLVTQRLQRGLGLQSGGRRGGGRPGGALGVGADGQRLGVDPLQRLARLGPARMQQRALQHADLRGEFLVALGLPRLALQAVQRGVQLAGDVVEPLQVGLGGAHLQLGFVTAAVQAGDAGGFLEDQPAVLRLGGDQLARSGPGAPAPASWPRWRRRRTAAARRGRAPPCRSPGRSSRRRGRCGAPPPAPAPARRWPARRPRRCRW